MNDQTPAPLTPIVEYNATAAALSDLRQRYANVVFEVTKPEGMALARKGRAELRTLRVDLEKKRVEIKAPALERTRLIDTEARRITLELSALEDPIDQQIKREEQRKERERAERERAEAARVADIRQRIAAIRGRAPEAIGKTAAQVDELIRSVVALPVTPAEFAELHVEAENTRESTLEYLRELHVRLVTQETEAAQIAKDRAELEELRKQEANRQAAARAEEQRIAAEAQAERDRLEAEAKAKRDREEEDARIARKAADDKAAAERAEADRLAAAQRHRIAVAEEKAYAAAQVVINAAHKAESDRLAAQKAEQDRQAAELAEKARQQAAVDAQREADAIIAKAADPLVALQAIVDLCAGKKDDAIVRSMVAGIAAACIHAAREAAPKRKPKAKAAEQAGAAA